MIRKCLLLFILLLFLIAPCTALNASAVENDQFAPPAYGVILASDEIDATAPDKKTAEAFLGSSAGDLVFDCLTHAKAQEKIPNETLSLTLNDFSYHTADGSVITRDITVSELLGTMNTTFTGYGWGGSYGDHEHLEISVGDPAWRSDLKNAYNFIQAIAKLNGFEKTIPIKFANMELIGNHQYASCIYWANGSVSCNYAVTPTPTQSSAPLLGILGAFGIAAVLIRRMRNH